MSFINKKGVSPIVATVLLIMLTVVAIGIITKIVVPFTKDNLSKSKDCFSYREYYTFDSSLGYNCYNSSGMFVTIKASGDSSLSSKIAGTDFIVINSGKSERFQIRKGERASCSTSGVRELDDLSCANLLNTATGGEVRTYALKKTGVPEAGEVKVFPYILKDESSLGQTCADPTDSIKLLPC